MKKSTRKIRRVTAIVLSAVMVIGLCACGKSGAEYSAERNIIVEELNGTSTVTSEDSGESDAYEGRQLVSGDAVSVASAANMTLKIDEDKHLFADSDTRFSIEASGKTGATKTKIILDVGCTLIGIENKLGQNESFEVATPNATMAVRGTTFRVTVTYDQDGKASTTVEVFKGVVDTAYTDGGESKTAAVTEDKKIAVHTTDGGLIVYISDMDGSNGEYLSEAQAASELTDADLEGLSPEDAENAAKILAYRPQAEEWLRNAHVEFTVDDIVFGEATIDDAKAAYSGDAGYMSNLMMDDTEDTVYSLPYDGDTPEGYTENTFGYLFTAPVSGGPITDISITDGRFLCIGGVKVGDSADAFWDYIGLRPDPELGDAIVFAEGDDGSSLQITNSSFYYQKDGKAVSVSISRELGTVTQVYFNFVQ